MEEQPERPISDRKLAANRENAKKSTGPKSAKGKAKAKLNSLIHGIFAEHAVETGPYLLENPAKFLSLLESVRTQFNPIGVLEDALVQQIADVKWKQSRLARYEAAVVKEQLCATISAISRGREEQSWTDMHLRRPRLRQPNEFGQWVTDEMLSSKVDLVAYLSADGARIEENEDFLVFIRDTGRLGDNQQEGADDGDCDTAARDYLAGLTDVEREELKRDFLSQLNSDLRSMHADRLNAAAQESGIERSLVPDEVELEKIMRYSTFLSRKEERLVEMLLKLQAERRDRRGGGA